MRRQIEDSVQPFATSIDGKTFEVQAPLDDLEVKLVGYMVLDGADATNLGQILTLEPGQLDAAEFTLSVEGQQGGLRAPVVVRAARGTGVILDGHAESFLDARVRSTDDEAVCAWLESPVRPIPNSKSARWCSPTDTRRGSTAEAQQYRRVTPDIKVLRSPSLGHAPLRPRSATRRFAFASPNRWQRARPRYCLSTRWPTPRSTRR